MLRCVLGRYNEANVAFPSPGCPIITNGEQEHKPMSIFLAQGSQYKKQTNKQTNKTKQQQQQQQEQQEQQQQQKQKQKQKTKTKKTKTKNKTKKKRQKTKQTNKQTKKNKKRNKNKNTPTHTPPPTHTLWDCYIRMDCIWLLSSVCLSGKTVALTRQKFVTFNKRSIALNHTMNKCN